jgi:hypothetical protein
MNRLVSLRRQAAQSQRYRCYYCTCPIWEVEPTTLISAFHLSKAQVALLRCTAEHLHPKSEGGGLKVANIVAACLYCNRTRHAAKCPLPSEEYKRYVTNRMRRGRWLAGVVPSVANLPSLNATIAHVQAHTKCEA